MDPTEQGFSHPQNPHQRFYPAKMTTIVHQYQGAQQQQQQQQLPPQNFPPAHAHALPSLIPIAAPDQPTNDQPHHNMQDPMNFGYPLVNEHELPVWTEYLPQGQMSSSRDQGQGQNHNQSHVRQPPQPQYSEHVAVPSVFAVPSPSYAPYQMRRHLPEHQQEMVKVEPGSSVSSIAVPVPPNNPALPKFLVNSEKYKRFKERIIEGVQETIDQNVKLSEIAKYFKVNSRSPPKEKENFINIFSIRCLMEIAYPTDVNERGTEVLRSSLYLVYHTLCQSIKVEPIGPSSIGKLIRIAFPKVKTKRLGIRGHSKYHYIGIKLKDSYLRLVDEINEDDSKIRINNILINNLILPSSTIPKTSFRFLDYRNTFKDEQCTVGVSMLLKTNQHEDFILRHFTSSFLSPNNGNPARIVVRGPLENPAEMSLLANVSSTDQLSDLATHCNFAVLLSYLIFCDIDASIVSLKNSVLHYHSWFETELKQVLEPSTPEYHRRLRGAAAFVNVAKLALSLSELAPQVDSLLKTQSSLLFNEIKIIDFDEPINDIIGHNFDEIKEAQVREFLKALVAEIGTCFVSSNSARFGETPQNSLFFGYTGLVPDAASLKYSRALDFAIRFEQLLSKFDTHTMWSMQLAMDKFGDDILCRLLKNNSPNLRNWLFLRFWIRDWLTFKRDLYYFKFRCQVLRLEGDGDEVVDDDQL